MNDYMLSSGTVEHIGRAHRPVGLWTGTKAATWAADAYRRVYVRELTARLPDMRAHFVADLPDGTITVSDGGDMVRSILGGANNGDSVFDWIVAAAPGPADLAVLGRSLDRQPARPSLIVSALSLGGTDDSQESITTVLATARDVTVRDASTRDRLQTIRQAPVITVPDPLVLVPRLTGSRIIRTRLEYLRTMDRYPLASAVVVEVSATHTGHLARLAGAVRTAIADGYRIVIVAVPMDGEPMTDELQRQIAATVEPSHCVERLHLDDMLATIASATAVVPISSSLAAVAFAYGRPALRCPEAQWGRRTFVGETATVEALIHDDFAALLKASPIRSAPESWWNDVDAHFDRLAHHLAVRPDVASPPPAAARHVSHLEAAQRVIGRRLADERLRFAERAEGLTTEIDQLKRDVARRTVVEAALRQEMADAMAHARHDVARSDAVRQAAEAARRALESRVAELEQDKAAAAETVAALSRERTAQGDQLAARERENADLASYTDALRRENADRAGYIDALVRERDELLAAVRRFEQSRSWRYLAPARTAGRWLRRVLGRGR